MASTGSETKRWRVRASGPLRGQVRVPGDKSIGHRALLFGALAEGTSTVRGLSGGLDNAATAEAMRQMGARIEFSGEPATGVTAKIAGVGLDGLKMPSGVLDCGNSGTTMRMLAGVLVAQKFGTRLIGDASLTRRPMRRIVDPLRARGGHIAGVKGAKEGEHYPPLSVAPLLPDEKLTGIEYQSPIASAQVKSALLLSGLWADGPTAVAEPTLSRDHTERMMLALGVPLQTMGPMVVLDPEEWDRRWDGFEWDVPGDISGAAFIMAAGLLVPGSEIVIDNVGTNPTRTGILDALRAMRAPIFITPRGDAAGMEPIAQVVVRHAPYSPTRLGGELVTRMIDEVPIFAAICTRAGGASEIRDAEELRVKESDRLSITANMLRDAGVDCVELRDGMTIHGGTGALRATRVTSHGDHRIAMTAAVLGLASEGETIVQDVGCVDTSFPGFADLLRSLGADIVEETA
ncbi:3-phosphoshikimate 1-carboxyvinyltransferase [Sandaracinus amylolyticus]|uniref:3-phosphoshikimate 1-carboxyvinyltransferase n=1 Tax=Sandaracinus amylolyticus TaxID=927083 RepID=A0A0F6W3P2_9BACT|nr:3-phosphoshikimate 1-carboxyvinyltransferase [Sandaracinus amylolyticus]AKF06605.1 5-Enolpyruvylshikimate-3-phosphate synthase [Sandaracinus amylolyticus]